MWLYLALALFLVLSPLSTAFGDVTSWRSPGTMTEDTSVGTQTIASIDNVKTVGGSTATIGWTTGTKDSYRYKATNWGFTTSHVPAGATIDGFEFRYKRGENGSSDNLGTKQIYMIQSDGTVITGTNNADTGEWPTTAATSTRGGATNKMGYTGATDTDVIDTDFGVAFQCGTIGSGTTPDGTLDDFEMRIYYTPGSTIKSFAGAITGSGSITDILKVTHPLQGAPSGTGAATWGTVAVRRPIAGSISGAGTDTATLSPKIRFIGSPSGAGATTWGSPALRLALRGAPSGAGTTANNLTGHLALAGTPSGAGTTSWGTVAVRRGLAGSVSGAGTDTMTFSGKVLLAGSISGAGTDTLALSNRLAIASAITGTGIAADALSVTHPFQMAPAGTGAMAWATPSIRMALAGAPAGSGGVTGSIGRLVFFNGTPAGSGESALSKLSIRLPIAGSINGQGAASLDAHTRLAIAGAISGAGSSSGGLIATVALPGNASGTGTITASLTVTGGGGPTGPRGQYQGGTSKYNFGN